MTNSAQLGAIRVGSIQEHRNSLSRDQTKLMVGFTEERIGVPARLYLKEKDGYLAEMKIELAVMERQVLRVGPEASRDGLFERLFGGIPSYSFKDDGDAWFH
jgi:hypothetical protein